MADLHRYDVRMQWRLDVSVDAINANDAKQLAEDDTLLQEGVDFVQAQQATLVQADVGQTASGQQLDRYDVRCRARRNVIVDAVDRADARFFATEDIKSFETADEGTIQAQQTIQIAEKTGTTA